MNLHEYKDKFLEIITATSQEYGIPEEQVEKDYYVSHLLEHLVREVPSLVFKGGTSLSKCYKVIKRFSEDIDINYAVNKKPTQSEKKTFKVGIGQAIHNAGLTLVNGDDIQSRKDHNNYVVQFPQLLESSGLLKKELIVETFVPIKSFPSEQKLVSSYILEFLELEKENKIIQQFELEPFNLNVQRIDRTFIDKIFAVCDYYERKKFDRNSRHLYDLHKIFGSCEFEKEELQLLFEEVRQERQQRMEFNVSAQNEYNLSQTLQIILSENVYKEDYEEITQSLLFEDVSYEEVKLNLNRLVQQGLIP